MPRVDLRFHLAPVPARLGPAVPLSTLPLDGAAPPSRAGLPSRGRRWMERRHRAARTRRALLRVLEWRRPAARRTGPRLCRFHCLAAGAGAVTEDRRTVQLLERSLAGRAGGAHAASRSHTASASLARGRTRTDPHLDRRCLALSRLDAIAAHDNLRRTLRDA